MGPEFDRAIHLEACWRQRSLIVGDHPDLVARREAFLRVHDAMCPNWEEALEMALADIPVDRRERIIESDDDMIACVVCGLPPATRSPYDDTDQVEIAFPEPGRIRLVMHHEDGGACVVESGDPRLAEFLEMLAGLAATAPPPPQPR